MCNLTFKETKSPVLQLRERKGFYSLEDNKLICKLSCICYNTEQVSLLWEFVWTSFILKTDCLKQKRYTLEEELPGYLKVWLPGLGKGWDSHVGGKGPGKDQDEKNIIRL